MTKATKDDRLQIEITKDWIDMLVEQKVPQLTLRLDDLIMIKAAIDAGERHAPRT